jgi:hypothetical protein
MARRLAGSKAPVVFDVQGSLTKELGFLRLAQ